MTEKPQDIGTDSKPQREKDVIDYNHELAGGENGRIKRFSVDSPTLLNSQEQEKRKSKERQFTSMLAYMLANDAQYRQLYFEVEAKLEEAQSQVDEALLKINQELDDIQYQLDNADELGLSEEQKIELKRKQDELERHSQEIQDYQHNVIDHIRQRMDDKDDPPDKDELQHYSELIETHKPESLRTHESSLANISTSVSAEIVGKPELSKLNLCNTFCDAQEPNRITQDTKQDEPNYSPLTLK